ncbi:MAG: hypothetical protein JWL85_801 [Candidatus Saccharibacteria bacterium]|nr:hypothetical protein [Candidatus Saccharibacteria bacterium]
MSEEKIYEKFGLHKNEYVNQYFFGTYNLGDRQFYAEFLVPLLLTFCFIWLLPKYIFIHAFIKEREYKQQKLKVLINDDIEIQKHREKLASVSKKTLNAEKQVAKQEQELAEIDPTKLWEEEYQQFIKSGLISSLTDIVDSVYNHSGCTKSYSDENRDWQEVDIDKDALAIAHSNGLINISNGTISLTDKGRYFVKQGYMDKLP